MSSSQPDVYNDMPILQNVADSDQSDSDRGSDDEDMDASNDAHPQNTLNAFATFQAQNQGLQRDEYDEADEDMPGLEPIIPLPSSVTTSSTALQSMTTPLAAPAPALRFAASQSMPVSRPRSSHRRARVESDDEGDTDRDRRHPSQRTGTGVGLETSDQTGGAGAAVEDYRRYLEAAFGAARPTQGGVPAPVQPLLFSNFPDIGRNIQQIPGQPDRISISIGLGPVALGHGNTPHHQAHGVHVHGPAPPNQTSANTGSGVPGVGIGAAAGGHGRMPWMNMGPGTGDDVQGQNTAGTGDNIGQGGPNPAGGATLGFADFLTRLIGTTVPGGRGGLNFGPGIFAGAGFEQLLNSLRGIPEREDPERARRLVDGLEDVPVGLVRRLERVAALGYTSGEETGAVGGDSGCAICWDRLLDPPGEDPEVPEQDQAEETHAISEDAESSSANTHPEASTSTAPPVAGPPSSASSSQKEKQKHPRIVSLPCAHIFHAECLIPWFTRPRQTTCPTCRFNIDPENLTATPLRRSQRATANDPSQTEAETDVGNDQNPTAPELVPPPPIRWATRTGLGSNVSVPERGFDPADPEPQNPSTGVQWFSFGPPGPGGAIGAGFGLVGLGMPMSGGLRTRSQSRPNNVRSRVGQSSPSEPSSSPTDAPGDGSSSDSGENHGESSGDVPSSAQAGPSTSTEARSSSASGSRSSAEAPAGTSGAGQFTGSSSNSSSNTTANTSTASSGPTTNAGATPNDTRGVAEALLQLLGLQGIVDPSHVNFRGMPVQPMPQNASTTPQNQSNAATTDGNPQPNLDATGGAARSAASTPTPPNPDTHADQGGPRGFWSFGVDLLIGSGPPPPTVVPGGMPFNPAPDPRGPPQSVEDFEDAMGDEMVMMDMDMMFGPEDGDHPPTPHIHHFHHHHHHHDHDHVDHEQDDHGPEGDLAAFQRMINTMMGIPSPPPQQPQPSTEGLATTTAATEPPQPLQNNGVRPEGLVFAMPAMPGVRNVTAPTVEDLLRAVMGGQPPAPAQNSATQPQRSSASMPMATQPQRSTTGTPATPSTQSNVSHALPPASGAGPSVFSRIQPQAVHSQSGSTSTLSGEINRLFGNVPPIRSSVIGPSGSEGIPPPIVVAPWTMTGHAMAGNSAPSGSQDFPRAQTRIHSTNNPATSTQQAGRSNIQSNASQSTTEMPRTEQSPSQQQGRERPPQAGGDTDEGPLNPNPLGRFLRALAGMPVGPPNGAPRPTGLGSGVRFGHAAIPGVGIRRATAATDGGETRQQRKWTPPPPPGLTLRQRIEKREREAGLRCWDPSCGVGPSDEDPLVEIDEAARRQVRIRMNASTSQEDQSGPGEEIRYVCDHTFHPSCLVSAQRVALRGAEENVIGDSVEVSCPVCRSTGLISKEDWDEGA